MSTVRYTLDTLPAPTAEDIVRLQKLAAMPDDNIDFSDIPPLTEAFWANAHRANALFRPKKQQITIRLDADVLAWLKGSGKGYQSRLNDILRQVMLAQTGRKADTTAMEVNDT
jgi:hypothetical protein